MKRYGCYYAPVLFFLASAAWAQAPVQSFSDVPSKVEKGEGVRVILRDGTMVGGRFDSISGSTVRLSGRDIAGSMVKEIQKKRPDSTTNGALIGCWHRGRRYCVHGEVQQQRLGMFGSSYANLCSNIRRGRRRSWSDNRQPHLEV
jgi:hypothetical protein